MRHSARARAQVAFACAALLAGTPGAAIAASNPVHIDPKSPVAKEYALPLATARGAAPESGQTGALFGSGITSSGHASAGADTPTPAATTTTPPPTTTPATTNTNASILTVTLPDLPQARTQATPAAYRVLRAGSASGLLWMIVAAALVLALGGAGGFLFSRRR